MDIINYFRFLVALVFVLGLIWLLALAARRLGLGYPMSKSKMSGSRRIQVVETAPVDGRRRLVLVRRDNVEHLLILGQNSETVIETDILAPLETNPLNTSATGLKENSVAPPQSTSIDINRQAKPE